MGEYVCTRSISLMVLTMALSATANSNDGASGDDTATKADTVDDHIGPHNEMCAVLRRNHGPYCGRHLRHGLHRGLSAHCLDNERPPLTVTLTHDFYMGETEVTRGEYESMTGVSRSMTPPAETIAHGGSFLAHGGSLCRRAVLV